MLLRKGHSIEQNSDNSKLVQFQSFRSLLTLPLDLKFNRFTFTTLLKLLMGLRCFCWKKFLFNPGKCKLSLHTKSSKVDKIQLEAGS